MRIHTVDAAFAPKVNSNQLKFQSFNQPLEYSSPPVTPRKHSPPLASSYLGWHERLRDRVPDPRARDVLVTLAGFMDEAGQVVLHVATLAEACGVSRSTFQRRARELARLGELTVVTRRVARDFNAPNTYIVNIHAGFRGGPCQSCHGKALKTNTKAESSFSSQRTLCASIPVPAKPPTRHIIASSRIAAEFCAARGIGHWQRRWLTERIEERLKAGEHGDAILADLDRQHRSRSSGEGSHHRGTWRSHRQAEEERMARDAYTLTSYWKTQEARIAAEAEASLRAAGVEVR